MLDGVVQLRGARRERVCRREREGGERERREWDIEDIKVSPKEHRETSNRNTKGEGRASVSCGTIPAINIRAIGIIGQSDNDMRRNNCKIK